MENIKNNEDELFVGVYSDSQNALLNVIKKRGLDFFKNTQEVRMTVRIIDDLREMGYEIVKK